MAYENQSSTLTARLTGFAPQALALMRIVAGLLFLQGGIQILFGFPVSPFSIPKDALTMTAGVLELVGGALVLVGFLTRLTAFVLSGMMAVAYWMAHAPQSFFPSNNMGGYAILYCFVFFYLMFVGPGAWSIDGQIGRSRA